MVEVACLSRAIEDSPTLFLDALTEAHFDAGINHTDLADVDIRCITCGAVALCRATKFDAAFQNPYASTLFQLGAWRLDKTVGSGPRVISLHAEIAFGGEELLNRCPNVPHLAGPKSVASKI